MSAQKQPTKAGRIAEKTAAGMTRLDAEIAVAREGVAALTREKARQAAAMDLRVGAALRKARSGVYDEVATTLRSGQRWPASDPSAAVSAHSAPVPEWASPDASADGGDDPERARQ